MTVHRCTLSDARKLFERWVCDMVELFGPSVCMEIELRALWPDMVLHYQQPGRFYHTLDYHVAPIIRFMRDSIWPHNPLSWSRQEQLEFEAAFWFHDLCYVTGSTHNEQDSACWLSSRWRGMTQGDPEHTAAELSLVSLFLTHVVWLIEYTVPINMDLVVSPECDEGRRRIQLVRVLDLLSIASDEDQFLEAQRRIYLENPYPFKSAWDKTRWLLDFVNDSLISAKLWLPADDYECFIRNRSHLISLLDDPELLKEWYGKICGEEPATKTE